jgi:hypothetical protein
MTMDNFKRGLAVQQCVESNICSACLSWKDLVLNQTMAAGCAMLSLECLDYKMMEYSLGCYNDTNIVPLCFGKNIFFQPEIFIFSI